YWLGAAQAAEQGPPRSEGCVPLPAWRSHARAGAEGRGSKPARAGLDGLKSCRLWRPAPRREATQGGVRSQLQDSEDRSFTNTGMSFHRPLRFLFATVIHWLEYRKACTESSASRRWASPSRRER